MIRLFWSFLISLLCPLIIWSSGHDYIQRDDVLVTTLLTMIMVMVLAGTFPMRYPGEKK